METDTQEPQYDNLRVHVPAADKLREVQKAFKSHHGVSATQSEILTIITDFYLANGFSDSRSLKAA